MEGVPSEQETIAVKRSKRLSQKFIDAHRALFSRREWWSNGPIEFLGIFLIILLNFVVLMPFFGTLAGSMVFSGPLIPLLSKALSLVGIPLTFAVQTINLLFILALPISFYFFVKKVSGRKFSGFISTLIISTPSYPFLLPRIESGIVGQEGSFISSLPAIFLSLIMLLNFLRLGEIKNLVFVSVTSAIIAMISPFGFFCYIILAFITAFSEILLGEGRLKFFRLLVSLLFSFSLCSFWYNPAFIYWMITGSMGEDLRTMITKLIPMSFFLIPILATVGYLLFDRKPDLQPLFLASFYTVSFAIFALAGDGFVPSSTGRYVHLFGISLGFLLGIAALKFLEYVNRFKKIKNLVLGAICFLLIFYTIYERDEIFKMNENVLGIWTDVGKGDVWLAKDEFGSRYSPFGYLITIAGIAGLTYLSKSSKMPQ